MLGGEFLDQFREKFADRMEEIITDPKFSYLFHSEAFDWPAQIRTGKTPLQDAGILVGTLLVLAQDLRLSSDETDFLKKEFLGV